MMERMHSRRRYIGEQRTQWSWSKNFKGNIGEKKKK